MTIAIAMYIMIVHHIQPYEKKWFNDFTLLIATVIPIAIGAGLPPIHSGYGSEGCFTYITFETYLNRGSVVLDPWAKCISLYLSASLGIDMWNSGFLCFGS